MPACENGYVFHQNSLEVAKQISEWLNDTGFIAHIHEIPHDDEEDGPWTTWALSVMLPFNS